MSISKYLKSTPIRETATDKPKKIPCQVTDCATYFPPRGEGDDGKPRKGEHAFADVVFTNSRGEQIALCCYHYDTALYRMGKGRMSPITGHGIHLIHADMLEHWKRLDAQEADNKARADELSAREYARLREGFAT